MTVFALTLAQVSKLNPCAARYTYALKHLPGSPAPITAAQARAAGCTFADLVWVAAAQAREDPAVARRLRLWMSECADMPAESNWQFDRLVLWLSDDEPEVPALPEPSV